MQKDRKTIFKNAFIINKEAIFWYFKSQKIISLFTTEFEYIAAVHAAKEAMWLCQLISQIFESIVDLVTIYSNNKSIIALMQTRQFHSHTKHIDIRYHFLCWVCKNDTIELIYCSINDMIVNILTKSLSSLKVKHFAKQLELRIIWGGVLWYQIVCIL